MQLGWRTAYAAMHAARVAHCVRSSVRGEGGALCTRNVRGEGDTLCIYTHQYSQLLLYVYATATATVSVCVQL